MANSWLVIYSMTIYLLISDVKSYIINNDLILRDSETDHVHQLKTKPSQSSHEDSNIIRAKKVVILLKTPVTDDVDVKPGSYLDTGSSEVGVVADRTPVTPGRRNYLTNLMFEGIRAISWGVVKFFICDVFSSRVGCTVMNVLSDEEKGGLSTKEGVAKGLQFVEDDKEMYYSAQKRST